MKSAYIILFSIFFSCSVYADTVECKTSVNEEIKALSYDNDEDVLFENYSFREIFFHGWGDITCPTFITLRYLTPDISDSERSVFCLQFDNELKTYTGFVNGTRDAYLNCSAPSKSLCERVNDTKDAALAITGIGAGAVGGSVTVASAAGVTAVTHSSGAVILTGTGGYISGTLGSIAAGSLAVLTAPATIATATISLVAVGGAVYFCKE